jgi:hypothetical protein
LWLVDGVLAVLLELPVSVELLGSLEPLSLPGSVRLGCGGGAAWFMAGGGGGVCPLWLPDALRLLEPLPLPMPLALPEPLMLSQPL